MNGIGLTFRQLKESLDKLSEKELDSAALIVGASDGYDFIDVVAPLGNPLRVGPKALVLFNKNKIAIHLQDHDIL